MVDLHKGFEGFERLTPAKKEEGEGLLLSKEGGGDLLLSKEVDKEKISLAKADLVKGDAFYAKALEFTRSILDRVRDGKEESIKAEEITEPTRGFCENFKGGMDRDDLVRLVFKNDEYKENYLYCHSVNVCLLAVRIALEMNFTAALLHELVMAALLHDIGMMKVPAGTWNNNRRIKGSEYEEVKKHALYGEEILRKIQGLSEVVPVVVGQHQEKVDGTGYPRGLTKDAIHFLARLISIMDAYEAQTHTRLWRDRFLPDKAIQQILDEESSGYDPHFIKAILRYISIYPVGNWVAISTGEIGEVVKTNSDTPMRPMINVSFDRSKKKLARPRALDLSKQLLIHVDHCVDPKEIAER